MRLRSLAVALVTLGLALPAWAGKDLDKAVTKAERQLAEGKQDDAVKTLKKAVSKARHDPEAPLALASLLSRLGRLDDAGAALEVAAARSNCGSAAVRARVLAARSAFALRAGTVGEATDPAARWQCPGLAGDGHGLGAVRDARLEPPVHER